MSKKPPKAQEAPAAEAAEPVVEAPAVAEQAAAPEEAAADASATEPAASESTTEATEPVAEPAQEAPAAEAAEPVVEAPAVAEDKVVVDVPSTHALMAHPDGGVTDAFPVDPTTSAFFVPWDQTATLLGHGFEVVGDASPLIWAAPDHTASVTLSIGTLVVFDGKITVPADISDSDRGGLVANGFQPAEA